MEPISITNFTYNLPDERIAKEPASPRDSSKLLVYKNQTINDLIFSELHTVIPKNSLIIYNNTKVVQARLFFKNSTGATIELFCLSPINEPVQEAMFDLKTSEWECLIGNAAKFREPALQLDYISNNINYLLTATKIESENKAIIKFEWNSEHNFAEILHFVGNIPLPPYFKRKANQQDEQNYQTVFAELKGSVAAPTAGLHFTDDVLASLKANDCIFSNVTLHVGAGTFMPVKSENVSEHSMHAEEFYIEKNTIELLAKQVKNTVAVGTTSLRTLESLYWLALQLYYNKSIDANNCLVNQWEPYQSNNDLPNKEMVLNNLLSWMSANKIDELRGKTQIIIVPAYQFKIVDILITNFHQPQSTLLLLVAALTNNNWKKIYEHALQNNYRFLSYGDSSILFL